MSMIKITQKGNFKRFYRFTERLKNLIGYGELDQYGREGVYALRNATPVDTGKTADSWSYSIERTKTSVKLVFKNSNIQNGTNIAIVIQYGHMTGSGVYVEGMDYINPALAPIFLQISNTIEGRLS